MSRRNWPRYARALDMQLAGHKLDDIAHELGVTRERARQMVIDAKRQLAFRVFRELARPLPEGDTTRESQSSRHRYQLKSPVSPSAPTRNVAFGSAPCVIWTLG
jgi:hypothetical protein